MSVIRQNLGLGIQTGESCFVVCQPDSSRNGRPVHEKIMFESVHSDSLFSDFDPTLKLGARILLRGIPCQRDRSPSKLKNKQAGGNTPQNRHLFGRCLQDRL